MGKKAQRTRAIQRKRRRRDQEPPFSRTSQDSATEVDKADLQLAFKDEPTRLGLLSTSKHLVQEQLHHTPSNQQVQRLLAQLQTSEAIGDMSRAVERNSYWGARLGWEVHVDQIVALLQAGEALPPHQSPIPNLFAEGVKRYQQSHNLGDDGIIGPNTWGHLRRHLKGLPKLPAKESRNTDRKRKREERRLARLERTMTRIYHDHGEFLQQKSSELGIDVADAAAFLKVESGGSGFSRQTGLMKIRFENHVFHRLWGKNNLAQFRRHFKFNAKKHWLNHLFRADPSGKFEPVHSSQEREQEVLDFARTLDDDLALQSISMGSAQVMGFNYELAGYESALEMFEDMSGSIDAQNDGLFSYIQNKRKGIIVSALQAKNYILAARYYNGKGKEALYGKRIKEASEFYQRVLDNQKSTK